MDTSVVKAKFESLVCALDERGGRLWAATEAKAIGHGGIALVPRATGVSYSTITRGLKELEPGLLPEPGRVRRPGGGRKKTLAKDATLLADLDGLVEPSVSGDPQSPLRWTSKSVRTLARELRALGHNVSHQLVLELLYAAGYSLQANRKSREGSNHPDRDARFRYIQRKVRRFQALGQPVISVDTKKKELAGNFKNAGKQWRPKGTPEPVRVHGFRIPELGKAIPYGVYDLTRNAGWVSVGIDHDTARFAVRTIGRWRQKMGRPLYRGVEALLVTADAGGSNGARTRLWKWELQHLANRTGLSITVCHFPPGTSKWNKIEHRLFSYISTNWRGRPLVSLAVIVNLTASTRTQEGLRVRCELDKGRYPKGQEVSDEQMAKIRLAPHRFHPDWNYTIHPHGKN
ncbi:MAG TPA: ISAzo13 family transposase [Sedimentisphaerales bacterium]|nr:ISAzo13 family transposase [Sedimentisphaerales bacterium]